MKRLLFASFAAWVVGAGSDALAADFPPPVAPPPQAPATYLAPGPYYSWTGFYIGGNVGVGLSSGGNGSDTALSTFSLPTNTSFLGGGQVGFNYEFYNNVVIGAEAMFDWLPNNTNTITVTGAGALTGNTASVTINNRWLTTVTGKLGYAFAERVLIYAKGGGAWVGASNPGLTVNGGPATFSTSSTTNWGWTGGFGVEWAFAANWSARAEYDYIGLSNQSYTIVGPAPFGGDTISVSRRSISMLTAGLNYKFGWGW
jgi:outer membrane immunogenic protein